MEAYLKKHYKYITFLGYEDNLVTYKLSCNFIDNVKNSLEYLYRTRATMRINQKKKYNKNFDETIETELPINVDFEKNSPDKLNLIEDLLLIDNDYYIIKLKPNVAQDLKYAISLSYKNRKKRTIEPLEESSKIKRGPRKKIPYNEFDYNITIPDDF